MIRQRCVSHVFVDEKAGSDVLRCVSHVVVDDQAAMCFSCGC